MRNYVLREFDLYDEMSKWLEFYLKNKYKNKQCSIITLDCHAYYLDSILEKYNVIKYYPQVVGLKIEIDVLGIVIFDNNAEIYFIEAKKDALTLQHLGQLLIYCKLCEPKEAFLFSSLGLGSLDKVLNVLSREDLLDFGNGKKISKIRVARWDIVRHTVDHLSVTPKL